MLQTQQQQTRSRPMELTFNFPNEVAQEIKEQPNSNEFVVKSIQKSLYEKWKAEEIRQGIAEIEEGDFASDEEVEAFFNKWAPHEKS